MHILLFGIDLIFLILSVKIVTSLPDIFTIEKALVKIVFGCNIFICQPIF